MIHTTRKFCSITCSCLGKAVQKLLTDVRLFYLDMESPLVRQFRFVLYFSAALSLHVENQVSILFNVHETYLPFMLLIDIVFALLTYKETSFEIISFDMDLGLLVHVITF